MGPGEEDFRPNMAAVIPAVTGSLLNARRITPAGPLLWSGTGSKPAWRNPIMQLVRGSASLPVSSLCVCSGCSSCSDGNLPVWTTQPSSAPPGRNSCSSTCSRWMLTKAVARFGPRPVRSLISSFWQALWSESQNKESANSFPLRKLFGASAVCWALRWSFLGRWLAGSAVSFVTVCCWRMAPLPLCLHRCSQVSLNADD